MISLPIISFWREAALCAACMIVVTVTIIVDTITAMKARNRLTVAISTKKRLDATMRPIMSRRRAARVFGAASPPGQPPCSARRRANAWTIAEMPKSSADRPTRIISSVTVGPGQMMKTSPTMASTKPKPTTTP